MKRKSKRNSKKVSRTKTKLGLPDLDQAKAAVLNSLGSPKVQRTPETIYTEHVSYEP